MEDWAKKIISNALREIHNKEDMSLAIEHIKGTAIAEDKKLFRVFLKLANKKAKL